MNFLELLKCHIAEKKIIVVSMNYYDYDYCYYDYCYYDYCYYFYNVNLIIDYNYFSDFIIFYFEMMLLIF